MNSVSVSYAEPLLQIQHVRMLASTLTGERVEPQYDKVILEDIDATVLNMVRDDGTTCGQRVGILAPSGTGKTVLFNVIAGLTQPTSGGVLVGAEARPTHAGLVGVVMQNYPLIRHRKVWGNLMLASKQKPHNDTPEQAVDRYLELFGLADKSNLYPRQLSGGQRQRIAIAQQLLCSEHLVLMDEPFSGLDMMAIERTSHLINDMAALDGKNTIIVVSHDIPALCGVSDHLWLMGREYNERGEAITGAKIMATYDLVERDLCWHPDIMITPKFADFVTEVRAKFRTL